MPACAPLLRAYSRLEICCIPSTPRTAPPWMVGHAGPKIGDWLRTKTPAAPGIRVWVAPQLVTPDGAIASRGDLLLWTDEYHRAPKLRAVQAGRTLAEKRTPWPAAPGRVYRAPWALVAGAEPAGGDVTIRLG